MNNIHILIVKAESDDFNAWYEYHKHNFNIILVNELTNVVKNDIMNNNPYGFDNNDYIMFMNEYEYVWYDKTIFKTPISCLETHFKDLDTLLIPYIYMSLKHPLKARNGVIYKTHYYRRNDLYSDGNYIIRYNNTAIYKFSDNKLPIINNIKIANSITSSEIPNVVKDLNCKSEYDASLRLYRYKIRSIDEYIGNIKDDKKYGDYTIPDFSVQNFN